MGDVHARVHIYTATALGRGRVASPMLGRLYPRESTRCSFYRRLSGPQDQSGHEGVKKKLHPSDIRDRTRAVQPVVKRLAAWPTWPIIIIFFPVSFLESWSRWLKRIGAGLRAGQPGFNHGWWRGGDFSSFLRVQTGPRARSASYKISTEVNIVQRKS